MVSSIQPGSKVAVVAPAGPAQAEAFDAGLAMLAARYQVVHTYDPRAPRPAQCPPYLADTDPNRAAALNRVLRDPEIRAIFCARGGFGCSRILAQLDHQALQQHRPLLVGFSDITALHAWAHNHGVMSIHGPVVTQLPRLPEQDHHRLFDLLEGRISGDLHGLTAVCTGRAQGLLFGGNLTLLAHLCGTPYAPPWSGRILLLEETHESPYRLDRLLTQLKNCGVFAELAGIVLGQFDRCNGPMGPDQEPLDASAVLRAATAELNIPVVQGAPVGHQGRNCALPLGVQVALDAAAGTLDVTDNDTLGMADAGTLDMADAGTLDVDLKSRS